MKKIELDSKIELEIVRLYSELSYPIHKIKKQLRIGRRIIERVLSNGGHALKTKSELIVESIPELSDKETLRSMYVNDTLSIDAIAVKLKTNSQVIKTAFKRLGIIARDGHETKRLISAQSIPLLSDRQFLLTEYVDKKRSVTSIANELNISGTAVKTALKNHSIIRRNFIQQIEVSAKRTPEQIVSAKIGRNLRSRLSIALNSNAKRGSAVRDLGCSIDELRLYLEAQFQPGMSWTNYGRGGWEIDHRLPLCSFDLTDVDEFRKACSYTNLQPLWARDNRRKSSKLDLPNIDNDLYIVSGPSGCGKSWVCNQLYDVFNYISYDSIPKEQHYYHMVELSKNAKPILYDPLRKPKTLLKRYERCMRTHLIIIVEPMETVKERLIGRGGRADTLSRFYNKYLKYAGSAEFSGTSNEVLAYLRSRIISPGGTTT